jgi:hypothetical protein
METMRQIPNEFKRVDRTWTLIERIGQYAIYKGWADGVVSLWEVHKVKWQDANSYQMAGKTMEIEEGEYLATNSDWGQRGWSPTSYEACLERVKIQQEKDLKNESEKRKV